MKLAQVAADEVGCIYQMPSIPNKNIGATSSTSGIDQWWNGMALTPNRDRQGLLPTLNTDGKFIVNHLNY